MSQPTGPRDTLRRRALQAILTHAFFRWESAVTISAAMLLSYFVPYLPVPTWQPWYWVVGAVLAEIGISIATLRNPEINARVVAGLLRQDFNPKQLHNPQNQGRVEQALEYRKRIEAAIASHHGEGVLRDHLREMAGDIDGWIANIYSLALRLDTYQADDVVKQDRRTAPQALRDLEARLRQEDNPGVRAQIEETIRGKQAQVESLDALENSMERANYQLEQTLTALGTVYSQLLLLGVKDLDSGRAQRLRQDIAEQVASLQDLSTSLDEVYHYSGAEGEASAAARQRLGGVTGGGAAAAGTDTAASAVPRSRRGGDRPT